MRTATAMHITALAAAALLIGCSQANDGKQGAASTGAAAKSVKVTLAPTQGHNAHGELTLSAAGTGVRITGKVDGLAPGSEHGFHIHEKGDCSAPDASSAGGHFNPSGTPHGSPGSGAHHAGDIRNLVADGSGSANVDVIVEGVSIGGQNDVLGKAVVVHESPDDYASQPAGNSGARIACGVIPATGG